MNNFMWQNPTNILFGKGQLSNLDSCVPKDARVLITMGRSSAKKSGLFDKVVAELEKSSDRKIFEFSGIEANPKFDTLMKAVKIVREEKIDFLLAVGGGSVMDGTKFIGIASHASAYIGHEEDILEVGMGGAKVGDGGIQVTLDEMVPLGTVVTLPATGSEMNNGGVITRGKDKRVVMGPYSFPKFSILDPEFTYTLPKTQVANGIIDTFIHVVEQYITYDVDGRYQDRMAEGILHTLLEVGKKTYDDPTDYDARANFVWSATMALNGLISSGVPQDWTTHMIGHEITGLFGVDHGKTLAVIQPSNWRVRKDSKRAKLLQYAERIWNITEATHGGSEDDRIEAAIVKTEEFFHSLGVKTKLSDYDIKASDIDTILEYLEKHGMVALGERGDVTLEVSRKILEASL